MAKMKVDEFIYRLKQAANSKTLYVLGGIGQVLTTDAKQSLIGQYARNREHQGEILSASEGTFAFDCCGLVKSILWGWNGDTSSYLGGATYQGNNVYDENEDGLLKRCTEVSEDMKTVKAGEFLWMTGHCGIYIGNNSVVEATPAWKNRVQITNIYDRKWQKHGKLTYIDYAEPKPSPVSSTENCTVALPVIRNGSKGNAVKALQTLLNSKGYSCGEVDGDCGTKTVSAINAFKRAQGWTAIDGICGQGTWSALLN